MTSTYATLEVSAEAYDEIKKRLSQLGYEHTFIGDHIVLDGIGLERGPPNQSVKRPHVFERSTLNHGSLQCIHCKGTSEEIRAIGNIDHCEYNKG